MGVAGDSRLDKQDKARSARSGKNGGDADWRGFINVSLTAADKALFDDWMRTDDPWDCLTEVVSDGAQISVKANGAEGGFMASVTQRRAGHINAGLCVTARAGEPGKALFRALFLVRRLGVEADWAEGQALADPDRW